MGVNELFFVEELGVLFSLLGECYDCWEVMSIDF